MRPLLHFNMMIALNFVVCKLATFFEVTPRFHMKKGLLFLYMFVIFTVVGRNVSYSNCVFCVDLDPLC